MRSHMAPALFHDQVWQSIRGGGCAVPTDQHNGGKRVTSNP